MQNVFVIEKDLEKRNFFYDILIQLNCTVTTFPSLEGLLDSLKKERPECIIIDIELDDDEAKAMLRKILKLDERVKIIVLVPGHLERQIEEELSDAGKVTCLNKDISAMDMVPYFLRVLREKKAEKEGIKVTFNETILIVDDEQELAGLVKNYLTIRGYTVDTAFNGEEALLKIKAGKPRVVLLDIMMPGMDGLLVLKSIKEIDNLITVIVTSGLVDNDIIEQARKLGADVYLNKPFSLEELEAAILTSAVKTKF